MRAGRLVAPFFALASVAAFACSPLQTPTAPTEKNPLDDLKPVDEASLSAMHEPSPVKNQESADADFLKDMTGRSARQAAKCDVPANQGPRETANVDVTYEPSGHVGNVVVHPPHEGTGIGECIRRAFEGAIVTGFKGEPVTVQQTVEFKKQEKK